jgi:hypothetical protein
MTSADGKYAAVTGVPIPTTAISYCVWFKSAGKVTNSAIFIRGLGPSDYSWELFLLADGRLYAALLQGSSAVHMSTIAAGEWNDDAVHQVLPTFDGTTLRLFVDGVERSNTTTKAGSWYVGTTALPVQVGYRAGDQWTPGIADDPAIWDRALTPAEIAKIYSLGRGF